jgi:outer membrane protein OmpA-like peptidoglycan-associated protein
MISTNVRNPSGYEASVAKANKDAVQLLNVMSIIQQNGKNLKESVAIKMVAQNKTITGLSSDLDMAATKGQADQSMIQAQGQQLSSANSKVRIQRVLEQARKQFSKSEAEAYQQGENLVVRLKQINFATGRSDLPAEALPLLAKVSEVAKSMKASQITVEGHTDSVGGPTENQQISEKRANAVATYFKTNGLENIDIKAEGYGFKKPISTNKSSTGRAQNRRVDVIITPETMTK